MTRSAQSRYPGYNVLDKRDAPSWDDATRQVIDERLATPSDPNFFNAVEWLAMTALCQCIITQERGPDEVPLAALVDEKLAKNRGDGYRDDRLPPLRDAWRTGLAALDDESRVRFELPFASIEKPARIALLEQMQRGELKGHAWQGMPSNLFFTERVLHDICSAYYSHPHAWSEMGFGGPANPRGYVRMYFDRRDPWEAAEASPWNEEKALKENRRAR
jgi:hypothetical protein